MLVLMSLNCNLINEKNKIEIKIKIVAATNNIRGEDNDCRSLHEIKSLVYVVFIPCVWVNNALD